jgi:hypothetical protein
MIRWLKQIWCAHRGHPYPTITVPIVGERPEEPEIDIIFCNNCSAALGTAWTDNAGTEYRGRVGGSKE